MDPPLRPFVKRRAVSAQQPSAHPPHFVSEGSPSPCVSNSKGLRATAESQPSQDMRPRNRTVSMGWIEEDEPVSRRTSTLQIEMADCVETKTVTTTTTTKRSYPPLLVRQRSLDQLNPKEYPLAMTPTPTELLNISYEIEEDSADLADDINVSLESSTLSVWDATNIFIGISATPTTIHEQIDQGAT